MVSGYGSLKQELQKLELQKSDVEEKNNQLFQDYIIAVQAYKRYRSLLSFHFECNTV